MSTSHKNDNDKAATTPSLRNALLLFTAAVALLSALGGYQLTRLVAQMNDALAQRSAHLLDAEEHMDDAAITLGRQVQEWKDMLLRADNKDLYNQHLTAFKDASVGVQYALLDAKRTMQKLGMDTARIDRLISEHKAVLAEYLAAYSRFSPSTPGSSNAVDLRIRGIDRALQNDITTVKESISEFAKRSMVGTGSVERHRTLMLGILGSVCLLLMAVFGLAFGWFFLQRHYVDHDQQ